MDQTDVVALFRSSRRETDALLAEVADELEPASPGRRHGGQVREFVRYAVGAGRRFRAFLARVSFGATGGEGAHVRYVMGAVELLHKASLIHDDIVDGDDLRRGRETFHHKFGVRVGTVVGDLVAALAFDLIERVGRESAQADVSACYRFLASGYRATASGELDDLLMEERAEVAPDESEGMLARKSGWLVATAAALGAAAAGAPRPLAEALHCYGLDIGTGFQILNDVNSLSAVDAASKGVLGADLIAKKKSLPVVMALEAAGSAAEELRQLWAKPELGPADAARAIGLVEATGALAACRARAGGLLGQAPRHLTDLPASPFRDLLAALPTATITEAYWREMD